MRKYEVGTEVTVTVPAVVVEGPKNTVSVRPRYVDDCHGSAVLVVDVDMINIPGGNE